ncbi:MAG: class I SAM-dependent rRNA methyltransferase [Myxococcota bacterium]
MASGAVVLRAGRERSVGLGHPWLLSGSVLRVEGSPEPGDVVALHSESGAVLGFGDFDPDAQIRVRITTFGKDEPDPHAWLEARLQAALALRRDHPMLAGTNALRLVHAEADGLPGLVIDRYADFVALRVGTPAMARRAAEIGELVRRITGARGGWLRSERAAGRELFGPLPVEPIQVEESGRTYRVDLKHGQKTGFYLDQRDARDLFARLARGARALDLFAHTGGFARAAQQGGASEVTAVESSDQALALARQNAPGCELVAADVNEFLRRERRSFDLISVDPPPFAKKKRDVSAASRAYKDLNLRAFARAAEGAHVLTFSCSHHVSAELFRKLVFAAALDAGREVLVLGELRAPADHPVSIRHPQGEYLKGLLLRVGGPA